MKFRLPLTILAVLALGGALAFYLHESGPQYATGDADEHGHHGHAEAEGERGPHGGRLLVDDGFTVELAIVEAGVPPEFRAWFTRDGEAVAPSTVTLTVELTRPGGKVETHRFVAEGDHARGIGEVREPHSFDYRVVAEQAGRTHRWTFSAPEMQTTIPADVARRSGVEVEVAGPATMRETLSVYGSVKLNADRVARAVPRFGGIVREARKALGDPVAAGETVAVVETNQSLATIEVKAPIAGVIVDRDVNAGETVGDGATLYTIADLSDVWVDLNVPKRDQARVKVGQAAVIHADDGGADASGRIAWLSPVSSPEAQTLIARIVLPNTEQRWRPGLYVKAAITLSETTVPVAVKESALQSLADFTVVFSQHGDIYQARPVELGRRGGGQVEVLAGLEAGERYVTGNSYMIKADIGKSGAAHEH
ncbi:MAG TPA: efflux RND transporter periplasmic adaptor subunit [Opitutus sp.]|nr:efflux RND transporter periplasmic adaptor subunit [Opitutus sp.]